jgi:hypothetical protein
VTAWRDMGNGWRTWSGVTGASWSRGPKGQIIARAADGSAIAVGPTAGMATARRVVATLGEGLRAEVLRAGADPFYVPALLALACIECPQCKLPCRGDCRKDGIAVPCNTPGADGPRSVGFYQLIRSNITRLGYTVEQLETSPDANHRAALELAREAESKHGLDLPTLAVVWNAGGVRSGPPPWGVHMWTPTLLSRYVTAWNAVLVVLSESPARSDSSSGLGELVAGAIFGALVLS